MTAEQVRLAAKQTSVVTTVTPDGEMRFDIPAILEALAIRLEYEHADEHLTPEMRLPEASSRLGPLWMMRETLRLVSNHGAEDFSFYVSDHSLGVFGCALKGLSKEQIDGLRQQMDSMIQPDVVTVP